MKRAMARDVGTAIVAGMRSVAIAALAFACAAQAQTPGSVNDYQLPPAPSPAAPAPQGPVDNQNPVARPTTPAPATPTPAEPVPRIELPASSPAAAPTDRPAATPAASQRVQRRAQAVATPAPASPATAPAATDAPAPPAALPSAALPAPVAMPAASTAGAGRDLWLALAAGGALLIAVIAFLLWRRRKPAAVAAEEPALTVETPAVDPPAAEPARTEPAAAPVPSPAPPPLAEAAPRPLPRPAFALPAVEVRLAAETLRLSVVYATLSYRLAVTNSGDGPLGALRISGDLASGHASLSIGQQLLLDGSGLDGRHELTGLAPGETANLAGELRLPLAQVVPLRAGAALFFAPLARFLIEAGEEAGVAASFSESRVFTIGLPSDRPGGAMQPLRLDLGPQLFRELDQREIDLSQWLPLDAARRAG